MTAQISDTFIFEGKEHFLIGIRGGDLISPEQFGMQPEMLSTLISTQKCRLKREIYVCVLEKQNAQIRVESAVSSEDIMED